MAERKRRKTKREKEIEFYEQLGIADPYLRQFDVCKKQLRGFLKRDEQAAEGDEKAERSDKANYFAFRGGLRSRDQAAATRG